MVHAQTSPTAADLQTAIEARCACAAALIQTVPVRARTGSGRTLDVDVHVFELADCAKTSTAYAWTQADRVFTALAKPRRRPRPLKAVTVHS